MDKSQQRKKLTEENTGSAQKELEENETQKNT